MIRCDQHKIFLTQLLQEDSQPCIKFVQCQSIPVGIPAVTELHIKIHQVHKAKTPEILFGIGCGMCHSVSIALVVYMLRRAPARKNIVDLAHGNGIQSCFLYRIQEGFSRRLQREIVPVGSTLIAAALPYKGAGDHPANTVPALQDLPGCAAICVQLLRRNHILMGGDLKHRIRRGIHDQVSGTDMLIAVLLNNRCPGPGGICQHAPAGCLTERLQHFLRETIGIGRQRIRRNQTGDLPVADGGVLTHGRFRQTGIGTGGCIGLPQEVQPRNVADTRLY